MLVVGAVGSCCWRPRLPEQQLSVFDPEAGFWTIWELSFQFDVHWYVYLPPPSPPLSLYLPLHPSLFPPRPPSSPPPPPPPARISTTLLFQLLNLTLFFALVRISVLLLKSSYGSFKVAVSMLRTFHTHTHARAHTHAHTRTHTRARAHTHTHTHTHTHCTFQSVCKMLGQPFLHLRKNKTE